MDDQLMRSMNNVISSSCMEEGSTSAAGEAISEDINGRTNAGGVDVEDGIVEEEMEEINDDDDKVEERVDTLPKVCRICHDVEDQSDLEAPCACDGTMKYAHRACVQKWCDTKGNIICEICGKIFKPNYSSIRTTPHPDLDIDIRENVVDFYEDLEGQETRQERVHYYCRLIGFIVMVLMIIRQILTMCQGAGVLHDTPYVVNLFIDVVGVMVPVYLVGQICYVTFFHGRW